MNAKELREAAAYVAEFAHHDPDVMSPDVVVELAKHVLSTVHDGDDELVTYEWLSSIKKPYMENRKVRWNFDGYTVSISSSGARFHCNHMPFASVQTRGQFRALCVLLGIVLEPLMSAK